MTERNRSGTEIKGGKSTFGEGTKTTPFWAGEDSLIPNPFHLNPYKDKFSSYVVCNRSLSKGCEHSYY